MARSLVDFAVIVCYIQRTDVHSNAENSLNVMSLTVYCISVGGRVREIMSMLHKLNSHHGDAMNFQLLYT